MLYPVLPLFLTGVLGAPPSVVGLIEGVAEGTASGMRAVSGRLADLRRRRPLIATGYGVSSVSKLLIGFAFGWPLVLVARFVDRVGKGLRGPPRDALIADDSTGGQRGRAFGFHRAADTAGAVVGPLLGLALYELLGQRIRPLFFVAFVPAAISVGLIFLVHERPHPIHRGAHGTASRRDLPTGYWRVLVFLTVFGLVNFSDALLILRAKELGLGFASIVIVYTLYNVAYAALSYPAGAVSDRLPRRLVFAAGLAVFAVAYTGLGAASWAGWVWVLLPLYGCYTALTDGVGRAWLADLVPPGLVGTGLGLQAGVGGVAAFVAGVWAGLAWGGTGQVPLLISGIAAGVLAVVLAAGGARLEGAAGRHVRSA
ncbi:MAG: MFS transporter [Acidimicrobiales bacterium]|nr:MFS transporter [Acidimicrobiales bacterium]